jgi:hypothetical protein
MHPRRFPSRLIACHAGRSSHLPAGVLGGSRRPGRPRPAGAARVPGRCWWSRRRPRSSSPATPGQSSPRVPALAATRCSSMTASSTTSTTTSASRRPTRAADHLRRSHLRQPHRRGRVHQTSHGRVPGTQRPLKLYVDDRVIAEDEIRIHHPPFSLCGEPVHPLTCAFGAPRGIRTPNRQLRSLVLCVDLVGSRRIWPAHVGCLVDPEGSRRVRSDRLDDQQNDQRRMPGGSLPAQAGEVSGRGSPRPPEPPAVAFMNSAGSCLAGSRCGRVGTPTEGREGSPAR